MKRIAIILLSASAMLYGTARAQPAPKKQPQAPVDPYAQPRPAPKKAPAKPADPYPDPVLGPQPSPGAPKPVPSPRKAPPPRPRGPVDPTKVPDLKAPKAPQDPYATGVPARVGIADVPAIQGLLAVQRLDGWLLFDRDGENPIARRLVAPDGNPSRTWFYMIPAKGQPIALVHDAEKRNFEHLPGTKLTYQGYRDLHKQIRVLLKGARTIALEYSPKAAVPNVSRVDAGTMELIRAVGVQVRSSDTLVQYTKAIWGDGGRTAHFVAVHHIVELRKEALAFITKQLRANQPVTEYDVQQRLVRGITMRGLTGPAPIIATGINTADPYYVPNASKTAKIKRGDLIVLSIAARVDKPDGVFAAQTWVAVADSAMREDIKKAFETVTLARDQAIAMITDRIKKNRPITGAEVDQATRAFIKKAGYADKVKHRTGHSIDNDFQGGGADLDDFEVKDTRILTPGTGFTVGPGLYTATNFGVRTEVSVYLSPTGPEVTTPAQDYVELLMR